jgi:two-component system, OmpR family, KDP operon response regulator KdpE
LSIFTASPYHHAIAVAGVPSLATKALALVVDDEATMRKLLRVTLVSHGFRVVEATSGTDALRTAAAYVPDVILLDLGLADMDGIAVVKQLREWAAIPVIVVSARSQEQTKVQALDAGADDYLDKPFAVEELMARVRVALKHAIGPAEGAGAQLVHVGDLTIDLSKRLASVGREEVRLTPTEYKLLALLVQNHGRVLTQGQLLNGVWGPGHDRDAQYLRVYVGQLRRKLERDPAHPRYLLTEAGVGYRFKVPTDSNAPVGPAGPTAESVVDRGQVAGPHWE